MNSLLFAVVLIFITTILSNAETNVTEIEDKIRNQRKSLEETARKLQESSRQQRMKHEEQMKASRERIEKIKAEAAQRTRPSSRSRVPKPEEGATEASSPETAKTEDSQEVKEAKKKLDDFIASEGGRPAPKTSNRATNTLELHGVDNSLIEELGRMATSSIPRDAMIQHVAKHFPEKKQDEWNEIVLSALAVKGKHAPDTSATDHARRNEARLKQLKFERSKASNEAKTEAKVEQKDL